jgi:hypothetical protein
MKRADHMQIIAGYLGKYTAIAAHHKFFDKYDANQLANISEMIEEVCKEDNGQKKACLLLRDLPEEIIDLSREQKITYEYVKSKLIFK